MDFAIAPCCWGVYWPDNNNISWDDYLSKISRAGYQYTELGPFGFAPTDFHQISETLAHYNVNVVAGAHVHTLADINTVDILKQKTHAICSLLAKLGASQFILMDESEFYAKDKMGVVDDNQWDSMIRQTVLAWEIANDYGLQLAFHSHVGTCVDTHKQVMRFLEDTQKYNIGLCFDTGHYAYNNDIPISFLKEYMNHIISIHLKNIDGAMIKKVHAENIHCDDAFEMGVMTDLDTGAIDMVEIVTYLRHYKFSGPVIVEQDLFEKNPRSPEVIAQHNLTYLQSIIDST